MSYKVQPGNGLKILLANLVVILCFLIVAAVVPGQTRHPQPSVSTKDQGLWQTLMPSDEEFSVAMPGITFNTTENRQIGDQNLTINRYQYQVGDTYYSINSTSGLYTVAGLTDREKLDVFGERAGDGPTGYDRIFRGSEVSQRAQILSKPEPSFTEEARKNEVTGVVRVSLVLNANGQVSNIRAVTGLPYGLTEMAMVAARQIKFKPAMKDGHPVSQYATIDYSFDIYYDEDEVTSKAVITSKPQPEYTEEARKHHVQGTVALKAILTKSGEVTGINVIKGLPFGLTEKAIAAAVRIKYEPAVKDGHRVSQYTTIEYNFDIY